jgi:hypothetical protein
LEKGKFSLDFRSSSLSPLNLTVFEGSNLNISDECQGELSAGGTMSFICFDTNSIFSDSFTITSFRLKCSQNQFYALFLVFPDLHDK